MDTCDLVVGGSPGAWVGQSGPGVRVMLGFDGRATNDAGSSLRGRVFADLILAGTPVVLRHLPHPRSRLNSPPRCASRSGRGSRQPMIERSWSWDRVSPQELATWLDEVRGEDPPPMFTLEDRREVAVPLLAALNGVANRDPIAGMLRVQFNDDPLAFAASGGTLEQLVRSEDSRAFLEAVAVESSAVVFPVLRNLVGKYWPATQSGGLPDWSKKYVVLLVFSLLTALIVFAFLRSQNKELVKWWTAFLAGFAWESFIEKVGTKSLPTS